jgi:hypothetical protein
MDGMASSRGQWMVWLDFGRCGIFRRAMDGMASSGGQWMVWLLVERIGRYGS